MLRHSAFWLWSAITLALGACFAVLLMRQRRRFFVAYRHLEEYADTLLQHGQGLILNVQGLASELSREHPVRQRIETTLLKSERALSELRERMQPHCSAQQDDHIK